MNTYYLIRHGQDYDNFNGILNGHRDQTLTETGVNQAIEAGQKIQNLGLKIDVVISSPLNRAYTTASIIASLNNFPTPIIEPLLIERDLGKLTGTPRNEIIKNSSDQVLVTPTVNYAIGGHGVETFPQLLNRANQLLNVLDQKYSNQKLLLVCHGDVGKMIFCAYFKLNWQDALRDYIFGNSEMLELSVDTTPQNAKKIIIDQVYC